VNAIIDYRYFYEKINFILEIKNLDAIPIIAI